jgi:hypothetical protein
MCSMVAINNADDDQTTIPIGKRDNLLGDLVSRPIPEFLLARTRDPWIITAVSRWESSLEFELFVFGGAIRYEEVDVRGR